jgi:hypothetical protein
MQWNMECKLFFLLLFCFFFFFFFLYLLTSVDLDDACPKDRNSWRNIGIQKLGFLFLFLFSFSFSFFEIKKIISAFNL